MGKLFVQKFGGTSVATTERIEEVADIIIEDIKTGNQVVAVLSAMGNQTEELIKKINAEIISVNIYDKKLNFRIYKDDFPNAYVTEDNIIYLSSGLLTYSPNYVSLLGVLAHEIGHIEKYHVSKHPEEKYNLENMLKVP